MTPKGAQQVIESMSLRVFEIEETERRLSEEKEHLRGRIAELESVRDSIVPSPVVLIG